MSSIYSHVRDVPDGTQITRPGIYRVPSWRYHHDPDLFPGHSVSSTGLRRMTQTCPENYWAYCVHNPQRIKQKPSEALRFGKAVHAFLLERDLPPEEFVISPFENWNTNEGKKSVYEYRAEMTDQDGQLVLGDAGKPQMETITGKGWRDDNGNIYNNYLEFKKVWKAFAEWAQLTIVTKKDIEIFTAMAERLAREPLIAEDGILDGLVEHTICWQDPATGIWVKIRPDVVPNQAMLGDLKATKSAHPREISKAMAEYGYHQQMALTTEGIARVLARLIESTYFVVIEKVEPYLTTIAPIDSDAIWWGARQNRKALDDIKRCLDADDWPGYGGGAPVSVDLPDYKRKQLLAYQEMFDGDPLLRLPDVDNLSEILGKL